MSDTPRTDAHAIRICFGNLDTVVSVEFARQLEKELTKTLAAANIQAGVLEQTLVENLDFRRRVKHLEKELEMIYSEHEKKPRHRNVMLEIRRCTERIADVGDACSCGRPYTAEHNGCSDCLYFICKPCGKSIFIG